MSRREDRSSESKRRRSGFDREPSPKKSRDGKPETGPEKDRSERDFKQHRTLDPKVESATVSKDSLSTKKYSQQHDDRGSVGQNGRSFSRRTDNERGWWRDSKQEQNDRAINGTVSKETQQISEKTKDNREEIEANPKPPMRKRPFREQKTPTDTEKAPNPNQDHPTESGRRRNERVYSSGYSSRYSDKPERSFAGERELNKALRVSTRGSFSSGDRYREGGDRFTARQGYNRLRGARVEKWKHDLYHEANRSPTPKNEEDQISKIEALLGS